MTGRLVVSYLIITAIVLAVLEIPLGVVYTRGERDRLARLGEQDATVLASWYEDALERRDAQSPQAVADSAQADAYAARTGARVVVVDSAGVSVVDTADAILRDFSTRPEIATALGGHRASGIRASETLGTDLLYVAVPVASGGRVHGAVRITIDAGEVTSRIRQVWLGLAGIALVVLAAIAAIGWAVAGSVIRPLRRLEATAGRFAGGDLAPAGADPRAPAEVRQLQGALDTMAGRLRSLIERQRSFVADASHQLRTPLTAVRLRLENIQSGLHDQALLAEADEALAETERLSALVDDLLALARAERAPEPVAVDLAAACRDRADTWSAVADLRGIPIRVDGPGSGAGPALWARAVPGGVEQILDNLLDNAIEASPDGGEVVIALRPGAAVHQLSVADGGLGLDDAQKALAAERFWRARPAGTGTGLGLAIVKALAERSGGTISFTDNTPTGLVVTVELPAAPAPAPVPAGPAAR